MSSTEWERLLLLFIHADFLVLCTLRPPKLAAPWRWSESTEKNRKAEVRSICRLFVVCFAVAVALTIVHGRASLNCQDDNVRCHPEQMQGHGDLSPGCWSATVLKKTRHNVLKRQCLKGYSSQKEVKKNTGDVQNLLCRHSLVPLSRFYEITYRSSRTLNSTSWNVLQSSTLRMLKMILKARCFLCQ